MEADSGFTFVAGWLFFWLRQNFTASQVLVTINTVIQLLAVAALPPLRPESPMLHKLTHLVAKTFAGIGVLDFIDNGGVALVSSAIEFKHRSAADRFCVCAALPPSTVLGAPGVDLHVLPRRHCILGPSVWLRVALRSCCGYYRADGSAGSWAVADASRLDDAGYVVRRCAEARDPGQAVLPPPDVTCLIRALRSVLVPLLSSHLY